MIAQQKDILKRCSDYRNSGPKETRLSPGASRIAGKSKGRTVLRERFLTCSMTLHETLGVVTWWAGTTPGPDYLVMHTFCFLKPHSRVRTQK